MKQNLIKEKSLDFSVLIIKYARELQSIKKEYILSKQIIRSGSAIGALVKEAIQAESKADFVHKLSISLKEATETEYWLEVLKRSNLIDETTFTDLQARNQQLIRLLVSIIRTSKKSMGKKIYN